MNIEVQKKWESILMYIHVKKFNLGKIKIMLKFQLNQPWVEYTTGCLEKKALLYWRL